MPHFCRFGLDSVAREDFTLRRTLVLRDLKYVALHNITTGARRKFSRSGGNNQQHLKIDHFCVAPQAQNHFFRDTLENFLCYTRILRAPKARAKILHFVARTQLVTSYFFKSQVQGQVPPYPLPLRAPCMIIIKLMFKTPCCVFSFDIPALTPEQLWSRLALS